jgi:hypothetical protein
MTKLDNGFKNDYMSVMFYPKREYQKPYIIVRDLTDLYNEPTAYTKKVRGIEKAWAFISQIMNNYELQDDMKMNDITKILDEKFNLDVHHYCAMD